MSTNRNEALAGQLRTSAAIYAAGKRSVQDKSDVRAALRPAHHARNIQARAVAASKHFEATRSR